MTGTEPRRRLKVDLAAIAAAFQDVSFESHYYLDRKTGLVIKVAGDVRDEMEKIYEDLNRGGDEKFHRFANAVRNSAVGEETRQALLQAHQVENGLGSRYVDLPPAHPHRELLDLEEFIETLSDGALRARLASLPHDPLSLQRLAETLAADPALLAKWNSYREQHLFARINFWLMEEGIEPVGD